MSSDLLDKWRRAGPAAGPDPLADTVRQAVAGIRFGSVELVIHEGRVVQIERREKVRFARPGGAEATD